MKKIILFALMVFTISTYSQKKKNGTLYIDHPAINTVESMTKAFVEGDVDKVASYLADDFKYYNGLSSNKDDKGGTKENYLEGVKWWNEHYSYLSITRSEGAYPDALEYKDGDNDDVIWVQTWEHMKAVHNETGVKIDIPMHRLFSVNKENKITTEIRYFDSNVFSEINSSYVERENGTIYNHHEYINKVRSMVHAFENNDTEKGYSFYDEKARFSDITMPIGKSLSIEEDKEISKKMEEQFSINSIDVNGYPDYLNYGIGNLKVVQSWWTVRLTRKSDAKKIVLPMMLINYFNDEGLIINSMSYFNPKLFED